MGEQDASFATTLSSPETTMVSEFKNATTELNATTIDSSDPEVPFYLNFREEPWVIPLAALSLLNIAVIFIFEIYVLYKSCGGRRHLFLGQILLLGLFSCSVLGLLYVPQPHWILCTVTRAGLGIAYAVVFGTMLVKCVFLLKLHDGVYFNASFQALFLFFVIGVEVTIVTMWMIYEPADLISSSAAEGMAVVCEKTPLEKIEYLSYVMFLLFLVIVGSIRARSLKENNKEARYIGLSIGLCLILWVAWTSVSLIFDRRFEVPAEAFGLTCTSTVVFLLIFIPKAIQLASPSHDLGLGSNLGSFNRSIIHTPSFLHLQPHAILPSSSHGTLVKQSHVNADW